MKKMIFLLIALLMATCFASGDLHVRIKCKPADPDTGYFARDVKVELWDSAEGGSLLYSACADKDYYAHFYNIPEGTYFIAIVGARDPMDMTGRKWTKRTRYEYYLSNGFFWITKEAPDRTGISSGC